MFISWAYNIYIFSTTPLLDFKQQCNVQPQITEHVRFRKSCSLHVLTRRKRSENAQCPNLAHAEYLINGRGWLGQRPHDHLDVSVSESIVSMYRTIGSWRAFCNRCDSGGLKIFWREEQRREVNDWRTIFVFLFGILHIQLETILKQKFGHF